MNKNSKLDVVHGTYFKCSVLGGIVSTTATAAVTIITITAMFIK